MVRVPIIYRFLMALRFIFLGWAAAVSPLVLAQAGLFSKCRMPNLSLKPLEVKWIGQDIPKCIDVFMNDKMKELKNNPTDSLRLRSQMEMALQLQKRVFTIQCGDVKGSASFITDRVFVTAGHIYHKLSQPKNKPMVVGPSISPLSCTIKIPNKFGKIETRHLDAQIKTYSPEQISSGNDIAISVLDTPLSNFEPLPLADYDEIKEDAPMMSSMAIRTGEGMNCFSVATCTNKKNFPPDEDPESFHQTTCPPEHGGSGGFVLIQKLDPQTGNFSYKVAGLLSGDHAEFDSGAEFNENNMFSGIVGLNGPIRNKLNDIIRETEKKEAGVSSTSSEQNL